MRPFTPTSTLIKNATLADLQVELSPAASLFTRVNDFLLLLNPYDHLSIELKDSFAVGVKGIFTLAQKKMKKKRPQVKEARPGLARDDEYGEGDSEGEDEAERLGRMRA